MSHFLTLFQGKRIKGRNVVVNIDGRRVMSSALHEFDWGPGSAIPHRRTLAAGLLFHGLYLVPREALVAAYAEEIAAFPKHEFAVTGDQIKAWAEKWHKVNQHGKH